MMNTKKICIFSKNVNGIGGIGRAVSILANNLCDYYDTSIICYCQDTSKIGYKLDKGIKVYSIFNKSIRMTYGIFKTIAYLYNYLKKEEVDTIIICGAINFISGIIAGKLTRTKTICCDHSNYTCTFDVKYERQSRNFAAYYSDYLVCLTRRDIYNYQKNTKVRANILSIPNIIDDSLIKISRSSVYDSSSKKIISVGRLTYAKNYELLIDIAKVILERNPDWSWDIYGDGELYNELIAKKNKLKVERLTFKKNVTNIYELYKDYALLVMTSRYEGFPMVLIEAMTNKIPCISFDCDTGPSDIITNDYNGYLIGEYDKDEMIVRIQEAIENTPKRVYFSKNTSIILETLKKSKIISDWKKII